MLGLVIPGECEWVGVAVDGVGNGYSLVEVGRQSGEPGKVGLCHGAGRFAVVKVGAVGIGVEVAYCAH